MKKLLLQKLTNGKRVYGTCITSTASHWVKAAKSAHLDFVFIDTEHISLERMEVATMCQIYAAHGIAPVVRIPSSDPIKACQMVDAGAEGIVAPYIENINQVKDLVGAIKYRPLKGERLKKILDNKSSAEPELLDYLQSYNAGNMCVLNIESVPAFSKLDELLDVEGVDAVFIGPHDLSVSLGLPEKYDDPKFEEVVKFIIHKCRAKNKAVGIHFSEKPERQIRWIKEGANIIVHSFDIAIFMQKLKLDMDTIRNAAGDNLNSASEIIIV